MPVDLAAAPRTGGGDDAAARRRHALAMARRLNELLGLLPALPLRRWAPEAGAANLDDLSEHLAGLCASVSEALQAPMDAADTQRHLTVLTGLHDLRHEHERHEARRRLLALAEVPELLAAEPGEDVGRLLQRAAEHAARICGLDRVMIFRLDQAQLIPEVTYFVGHAEWAARVQEQARPIELSAVRYEMEMIRRRAAALVTAPREDPRVTGPTMRELRSDGFVGVPVVVGGSVVATLHGDTYFSGRPLNVLDRDHLAVFAKGLGLALERSALQDRLTAQRDAVRRLVRAAEATVEDLASADLELAPAVEETPTGPVRPAGRARGGPAATPLTRREHEVLTLMARGATNREIAHRLVITEGTVKSHVKHLFRKLGVVNRAQAVSLHLGAAAPI